MLSEVNLVEAAAVHANVRVLACFFPCEETVTGTELEASVLERTEVHGYLGAIFPCSMTNGAAEEVNGHGYLSVVNTVHRRRVFVDAMGGAGFLDVVDPEETPNKVRARDNFRLFLHNWERQDGVQQEKGHEEEPGDGSVHHFSQT